MDCNDLCYRTNAALVDRRGLVSNRVWQVSLLSIVALCDGLYDLCYRTNAALVDRRGLGSRLKSLLLFPVPNHAQIQSIPGLVGDPQCYF